MNRANFLQIVRKHIGVKFSHQGRNTRNGLDCGGLLLVCARQSGLTELEVLGYADFPNNGKFEQLLDEHADFLNFESDYPHRFRGGEFLPGDLLAFDYKNGEGIRHVAIVSKWEKNRYWVVDAQPDFGVSEHPLAHPFSKAKLFAYRIRGLIEYFFLLIKLSKFIYARIASKPEMFSLMFSLMFY